MIDEETILSLSLEAAWKLYVLKKDEMLETRDQQGKRICKPEDYNLIRSGININFELQDYFDNLFRAKPKDKEIVIHKEIFDIKDFRTELEEREKLLRGTLFKFYSVDKDIIKM